jgi:hypothetical protein
MIEVIVGALAGLGDWCDQSSIEEIEREVLVASGAFSLGVGEGDVNLASLEATLRAHPWRVSRVVSVLRAWGALP